MNTNESTTPTTARRPKQYGFQPSPYADKKPVTMRLSREARELLDAEARSENTSITELVEQIVRQRVLVFPDGEKLSVVDFPVDRDEMRRNQESAHAEIARLVAEHDALEAKWKAATASLEVYSTDAAKFLARAEAAEAEVVRLQATIDSGGKKPVHRFSFTSIQKHWPETQRNRYSKLGWKPDEWMKIVLETAYDMLDELGA